jgi:hypothetical protein
MSFEVPQIGAAKARGRTRELAAREGRVLLAFHTGPAKLPADLEPFDGAPRMCRHEICLLRRRSCLACIPRERARPD